MNNHQRSSNMTLIAINVLLNPDAATIEKAQATNSRLREDYPDGFALDANHAPHISILHRFVRTADLEKVANAVAEVLCTEQPMKWESKATGYYDLAYQNLGFVGIVIEPTQDLRRLQQRIIDAVAPFAVEGTGEAFAPRPDGREISQPTVDYVNNFVGSRTGTNYHPHLTVGIGTRDFVDALKAEPFEAFTVKAVSVSLYQVGDYGVAQRKLYDLTAADPLPSWNDGPAKQAILAFIAKVTKEGSPDYLPLPERIAVYDNDGTLWPENPLPFQATFAIDELNRRILTEPKLASDPMVKAALSGDLAKLLEGNHYDGLMQVLALTHAGMTIDEFREAVEAWLTWAKHPRYGKPYDELTYQSMQELLRLLRANGFKNFIVSGGGADFMRVWVERVYGIPPEQVVGSTARTIFELRDSEPVLTKTLDYLFVNDKEGKPVGIHQFIGRRPTICCGNSDGDHAMLQYTTINNPRPSFGLIVHHTDGEREYAYDAKTKSTGKLVEALKEAPKRGWLVVDMKQDWKTIFRAE
jgi:phosphoglycolate phosphatase-like HAD superfamily hydrolase/2'-5' RNA ligase